jgi:hypothetical protein
MRFCGCVYAEISINNVGYLYPDGIVEYDGSSPQIDRTTSKETLYSSSQRYVV